MAWYRMFSTLIDDGDHQSDKKTTIVLHLKVNDNSRIDNSIQMFGYTQEWDGEINAYAKYPFILQFESTNSITGKMNYGGWDTESDNRLNIFDKEVVENEIFTFSSIDGEQIFEYIYRIDRMTEI